MSFESGDRLGPYEIRGKIGEGGMGAVYRAVDPRIGREVAIKVLPAAFVGDAERRARFEREAKLLASLNHPNVAQLYGVEEGPSGTLALVMELVEGTNLDERLAGGALPFEEAVGIGREIAWALADAHDKGIVHRDLKPQNVRMTTGGSVKVLDFGLAKALDAGRDGNVSSGTANSPTLMNSPTLAGAATELGVILGTAAYMSPEQARGRPIDRRADVWAFGCILFEMLSGERLFGGETTTDTLAAVMRREIPWEKLPAGLPQAVRLLLKRCLERDSKQRLRDLGDAALLLSEPAEAPAPTAAAAGRGRKSLLALGAVAIAIGLLAGWALFGRRAAAPGPVARPAKLAIRLPERLDLDIEANLGQTQILAISPDGSRVAFVASREGRSQLWLRDLAGSEVTAVTEGAGASSPFFSPDGRWLAYFANGKLLKVSLAGGEPFEICDTGLNRGGVWLPDGTIVMSPQAFGGLVRVPATGGAPEPLTHIDEAAGERSHRWPALLPGGREVAFTVGMLGKPGDYEDAAIDVVEVATGKRRRLLQGASMVRFTGSGHVLLGRDGEILSIPLAEADGEIPRDPARVFLDVAGDPASGVGYFDAADDGTIVYAERGAHARERKLGWIDSRGEFTALPVAPLEYRIPRLSPDGKTIVVAVGRGRGGASDLWLIDAATGASQRFTFDGRSAIPAWSPDGRSVVFGNNAPRPGRFAVKPIDGSAEPRVVATLDETRQRGPLDWAPDGTLLFQEDFGVGRGNDIQALAPGDPTPRPVAQSSGIEIGGTLSPDGKLVAYSLNRSGSAEFYIQAFPGPGGRWQVWQGTNGTLRWGRDGRRVFIHDNAGMLEIPIDPGPPFAAGKPRILWNLPFVDSDDTYTNFDVAPDGRFLVVRRASDESTSDRIVVALDWSEELRKLAPLPPR